MANTAPAEKMEKDYPIWRLNTVTYLELREPEQQEVCP